MAGFTKPRNADLSFPPSLVAEVANLHPVVLDQYHFHPGHTPASQSVETQQPHQHRHVNVHCTAQIWPQILTDADNSGLAECLHAGEFGISIADAYEDFCESVSLADFLVIAAEAVMTASREHVTAEDSS